MGAAFAVVLLAIAVPSDTWVITDAPPAKATEAEVEAARAAKKALPASALAKTHRGKGLCVRWSDAQLSDETLRKIAQKLRTAGVTRIDLYRLAPLLMERIDAHEQRIHGAAKSAELSRLLKKRAPALKQEAVEQLVATMTVVYEPQYVAEAKRFYAAWPKEKRAALDAEFTAHPEAFQDWQVETVKVHLPDDTSPAARESTMRALGFDDATDDDVRTEVRDILRAMRDGGMP